PCRLAERGRRPGADLCRPPPRHLRDHSGVPRPMTAPPADSGKGPSGKGRSVRGGIVTYRNGHTALMDASSGTPTATNTTLDSGKGPSGKGLSVRGVTVTYRNGHTALRDASFETPTGTITALVGVNGSGKSTLFKAIMGFVRLARGEITILGGPVSSALESNL